ncbi:MAG: hypothetical protein NT088_01005 [Candidatus Omnitrophica bacterium]|nr:hypothetical protein [Candidatus Omnitrophota bacterium]
MQKILLVMVLIFFLTLSIAIAKEPAPNTHIYSIEFKKPVKGSESVQTISIVFFVKVTSQQAEAILREELDRIVKFFPPSGDVLATAWFSPTGNYVDEQQIALLDGSSSLIFSKEKGKILTWKERKGVKTQAREDKSGDYFIEYEEEKLSVDPSRKFATLKVVFNKEVDRAKIYKILVAELKHELSGKTIKWPTTAYAFIGSKNNPSGQVQVNDVDGSYIFIEYEPSTGKISKQNKIFSLIPK